MSKEQNNKRQLGPGGPGGPGGRGMGMGSIAEKPKDFNKTAKVLISRLMEYKFKIVIVIIFAILSTIFSIVGPKLLGNATTKVFEGIMSKVAGTGVGIDFAAIGNIMIWLIFLYGLSALFSYIQSYITTGISMEVTYNFRSEISKKINKLPLSYFDKTTHGDTLSRITNDIDTVSQSLTQSLTQIITSVTTVIGIAYMMFTISITMTLVTLLILPLSFIFVTNVVKISQKYFKKQQASLGKLNGHVEENYGGHTVIKAFNMEEKSVEEFNDINEELYKSAWKSQYLSSIMMPAMSFIGNLGYVAICILGGYLASAGSISVGDIQAFIQYMRSFIQPISQIANISNVLQSTVAAAERVFEFLDEEEQEEVRKDIIPFEEDSVNGDVEFRNVTFGYEKDKPIIKNFSAKIKAGQKVAIVGPTGGGKTTLVKLLMRFYDIDSGEILIDGVDITKYTREDLRKAIGMVLQDTWLYNASVLENIRYGRLQATEEEVKEASKAAHVHHFIKTQPDGYDMVLNEDSSNISSGQKQLLTIARAILADNKILILDEATSSVDTRTEILIVKAMEALMEKRTSFVIAHRLSTIKDADLILVLKEGNVIEQGNHQQLLEKEGFYYTLYNSQFEE